MIRGDALSIGALVDIMQPYAGGASFVGPLDSLPSTAAGYSLRRLLTSYVANKAVNIRRSSDNATQDVGFTAAGDFDGTSFSSFVGAGTGFVTKWYDQSGNANDASQGTAANQPQITLNSANGHAVVTADGSRWLTTAAALGVTLPWSETFVGERTGSFSSQNILLDPGTGADHYIGWDASANTMQINGHDIGSIADSTYHVAIFVLTSSAENATIDGSLTSFAVAGQGPTGAATLFNFNSHTLGTNGNVPEILVFGSDITSSAATLRSNQKAYYGTP